MKAVTGAQMGEIDKYSIEKMGIPGIVLMENAALKIVKHVNLFFMEGKASQNSHNTVVIIAGKGNNAGDAYAVSRHLLIAGYDVITYSLFDSAFLMGDAKLNHDMAKRLGADMRRLEDISELGGFTEALKKASMVIDGIFGTGFKGVVKGFIADVMNTINSHSKFILSIDIASGTEAATGKVSDTCIKAHRTVAFELPKIGQLIYPGAEYAGELVVESISMPQESLDSVEINTFLTDRQTVRAFMPVRAADANKGSCGKVAVVTGAQGMAGAGCMASKACLRTGSGLVYVAAPRSLLGIYQCVVPEAVGVGLAEYNGVLGPDSVDGITGLLKKCNAAVIGPGLSSNESIYSVIKALSEKIAVPVVLDADALNALSADTGILASFKKQVVITPHPGEMARLTGLDTGYIQRNRLEVARKFSRLWGVTLVLKGARTIIADSRGTAYINPTGNAGMATAGSGDSLSGIIASLMGQGAGAFEAAVAGVYLHGLAGDISSGEKGEYGLTAMDIVENIPGAIKTII